MAVQLLPNDVVGIDAEVFIETGTGHGTSILNIVHIFKEIHSIEWNKERYDYCTNMLSKYDNVHIHLGSSPEVLPKVIDPSKNTLFFLDAHFCGGSRADQDNRYGECPLLEELSAITAAQWIERPVIIIDDEPQFTRRITSCDPAQWPTYDQIKTALPDYDLSIRNDMIYAFPD